MKRLFSVLALLLIPALLCGCFAANNTQGSEAVQPVRSMELEYAKNFSVDYFADGCKLISVSDGSRFLVVPPDVEPPEGIDPKTVLLRQPIENIYLAATSAMCLFDELNEIERITLTGTKRDGWYSENARKAMDGGSMVYAGKYSAPDYELILNSGCSLAVESMMISHTPEVKEKLNALGIPVLTDLSSYEPHPLGRTEWIKLYAALFDKETQAQELFSRQVGLMREASSGERTGKTVAFFYISSANRAVARKTGDYITKLIELAGGEYIFSDLGDADSALSTAALEMEAFYAAAKDADIIIYNSAIDGGLNTLEELTAKNSLLSDFKAVKNGDVWCTNENLYQKTTQLGLFAANIRTVLTGAGPSLTSLELLYRLQ